MDPITITLLGEPKGKGRGRVGKLHNGRPVVFTPEATRSYEASLRHAAAAAMVGRAPLSGAVEVHVEAHFPVPASWSQKKRAAALRGEIRPTKKPDLDNILKSAGDALNQVVWGDDAQITSAAIGKVYGLQPKLVIVAWEPSP